MQHTYEIIELVGSSTESSDDAIARAISTAGKTHERLRWFEVLRTRGHIEQGKIAHFQVTIKVGLRAGDVE